MEAVDRMLSRVGEVDLEAIPQMEPVRRALLEDAIQLLDRFVADESDNSGARVQVALAHDRLGRLLHDLGRQSEAVDALRRAVDGLDACERERVDVDPLRLPLALSSLARTLAQLGSGVEAKALHHRADELFAARAAFDGAPGARVRNRAALADCMVSLGETQAARELFESVLADADALIAGAGADQASLVAIGAEAWNQYGLMLLARFSSPTAVDPAAENALSRAIELHERLAKLRPSTPKHQSELATSRINLGGVWLRRGEFDRARALYRSARESLAALVRDFPSTVDYELDLASAENQLGLTYDHERRSDLAIPHYQAAIECLEAATRKAPNEPAYRARLGSARHNISGVFHGLRDHERAHALLLASIADFEHANELAPGASNVRERMLETYRALSLVKRALGDHEGSAATAELFADCVPGSWGPYKSSAFALAECVDLVRSLGLDPLECERLVERYSRRACEHIRAAILLDAPYAAHLAKMRDYEPLRDTPAFAELLEEWR